MNFFTITCIVTLVSNSLISLLFFTKVKSKGIGNNFGWTSMASATWAFGALMFSISKTEANALFWIKIAHIGIILTPTFFSHFIINYTKSYKTILKYSIYLLATIFLALDLFCPAFFNIRFIYNQFYYFNANLFSNTYYIIFYIALYWVMLMYVFYLLIIFYINAKGILRNQAKYFIISMIVAWLGPEGMFLLVLGIPVYPFTNLLIAIYPIILAYAIFRHQLMDIDVVIKKTLVFTGLLAFTLAILILPTLLVQEYLVRNAGLIGRLFGLIISGIIILVFMKKIESFLINITDR